MEEEKGSRDTVGAGGGGRNVRLESGLSQRNPQSEGGMVEPAAGGRSLFHDTQSQGGRLIRSGLSFMGTTVAIAMCQASFSPGLSCLFFA